MISRYEKKGEQLRKAKVIGHSAEGLIHECLTAVKGKKRFGWRNRALFGYASLWLTGQFELGSSTTDWN
jgi:hypothetical protein